MIEKFPGLNRAQQEQVEKQLQVQSHDDMVIGLVLGDITFENFTVLRGVLNPNVMVAKTFAEHLYKNRHLIEGKTVFDVGTGTGLQGIVCARAGAHAVVCSDITEVAAKNASINIQTYGLTNARVIQSDLFENLPGKADVVIFNHPFFPTAPLAETAVSVAMFDEGDLIKRFLQEASEHLTEGGVIIMPYFEVAGETNDPENVGKEYGYDVQVLYETVESGAQTGRVKICYLRKAN